MILHAMVVIYVNIVKGSFNRFCFPKTFPVHESECQHQQYHIIHVVFSFDCETPVPLSLICLTTSLVMSKHMYKS